MVEQRAAERLTIEIIEAELGQPIAAALERVLAGTRVYIPERPGEDHLLSRVLGQDGARLLGARFGGEYLSVPNRHYRYELAQRRAEVARLHAHGVGAAEIARRVGITERHVYRLLRGL